MGDGGRSIGGTDNLIKVGGLTRLVWQKILVSQFLESIVHGSLLYLILLGIDLGSPGCV